MSTPSSSPRIPMSPDLSRRRIPRPKDKRRALRDFYGIQQNQDTGPVEYDALLDGSDFDVTQYLIQLNQTTDVKALLKLENQMIRDIRVLDGERKALVYDNYGKMIIATDTIKHVTTEMQPLTRETFSPILDSITDLTRDIDAHAADTERQSEEADSDPDELLEEWLSAGPDRVQTLIDKSAWIAAKDEIADLRADLSNLVEMKRAEIARQLDQFSVIVQERTKSETTAEETPGA